MSLPIKAGIAALTIGSVSTAGYFGGTYLFGRTPIKDLINKEYQYILLDTTGNNDSSYWDANWKTYQDTNTSKDSDDLGLEGWVKEQKKDLKDKLKLKCKELSSTSVYGNEDLTYKHVTKYCARGFSIADEVKAKSLRTVNTETGDTTIWQDRVSKKGNLSAELQKLGVTGSSIDENAIKKGCKDSAVKTKQDKEYDSIYSAYKRICTKQTNEQ